MNPYATLLFAAAVAIMSSAAPVIAQTPAPSAGPGRFQLVRFNDHQLIMIDTATGHCWSRNSNGLWRDEGNPTRPRNRVTAGEREMKKAPPKLKLESEAVELVILQREERAIPGSDGQVRIRLGDVTDGQAFLSIVTNDDDILLDRRSVSQGDSIQFSVGADNFVLRIQELRNILIGDDFAKITVSRRE